MAAQEQEEQGESQYGSQSQALGGGAGGTRAGTPSLEYDHQFQFEKGDTKVDITITGEIPLHETATSTMVHQCSASTGSESAAWPVQQLSGSGKVNLVGTADWTADSSGCVCSLNHTIEVSVQGVTFYEFTKPARGGSCQSKMVALKVMETWNTERAWQCTCKTPEDVEKMHVEENLAMFASWGNPDLAKMTMLFDGSCPLDSDLVVNLSPLAGFGKGEYWWTYHPGGEGPNELKLRPDQEQWDPNKPSQPYSCIEGEWGPPLETIMAENPVPKWDPVK